MTMQSLLRGRESNPLFCLVAVAANCPRRPIYECRHLFHVNFNLPVKLVFARCVPAQKPFDTIIA